MRIKETTIQAIVIIVVWAHICRTIIIVVIIIWLTTTVVIIIIIGCGIIGGRTFSLFWLSRCTAWITR